MKSSLLRCFLFLSLCLGLFVTTGCLALRRNTGVDESRYTETIRLACVGDSITFGVGTKERSRESYPAQLAGMLGPKWAVSNFGNSGSTLLSKGNRPYIQQKQYKQALEFKPHVVVIKLGTNDSKPINWEAHRDEFVANYEALIASFETLETKPVIYLCRPMPCFLPGEDSIREKVLVEQLAPKIAAIAKAHGFVLIDLHTPIAGHPELVPDKIHPNAEGARRLAEAVYFALKGMTK